MPLGSQQFYENHDINEFDNVHIAAFARWKAITWTNFDFLIKPS